jgi:hypothetical protein
LEAGAALHYHLAIQFGLELFSSQGQPHFTSSEQRSIDSYVRRIDVSWVSDAARAARSTNDADLQTQIRKLTVAFALKRSATNRTSNRNCHEIIASLTKSWLFDLDPMSWINISELLRDEELDQSHDLSATMRLNSSAFRGREALYVASLFEAYVGRLSSSEIFMNGVAAEIIAHHIAEFSPQGGIFSEKSQANLRAHLVVAEAAGLL